ncbi:ABC transporter permease [Actinomyces bowdenii]|uniref:ABC transporter permease n=1 Tax=Actinomyces bowdenii TaxID=131109 RepID=UPI001FB93CEB
MLAQQARQAGPRSLRGEVRRSGLLARRTIRKHPGLVGAILVLSLIAGLLSNIALVMLTQHSASLEAKAAQWDSPDVVAVLPQDERAGALEADLRSDGRITDLEVADGVMIQGSIPYSGSSLPSGFLFHDIDDLPSMGRWDVSSRAREPVDDPVWVPSTLQESGGYELGDELVLTSPMGRRAFHIQGFVESTYGGMPPMGILWFGLPSQDFHDLQAEAREHVAGLRAEPGASGRSAVPPPGWVPSAVIKARVQGGSGAGRELIAESAAEHGVTGAWDMDRELVSLANRTSVGLVAVVVLLFSSMITAMSVLMLVFMLRGAIREDLEAIGMLRAMGFTTGGVMRPMVLCLAVVAALGAGLGAGLGHAVLPLLSRMLRAQTGITWRAHADPMLLLGCAAALGAVVLASGALVARRASRITTVEALRGGQADHSFARVRLPLQRTRGPLALLLGIKAMLAAPGRTLLILVVSAACTLASVFSASGLGMLSDRDSALSLLLGDSLPDVTVVAQGSDGVREAVSRAEGTAGVEAAIPFDTMPETVNGVSTLLLVVDDAEDLPRSPVHEGRPARHPNEIVLGPGLAQSSGVEVGDTWTATREGVATEFLVTGLASGAANFGTFAMLTRQGFEQLAPGAPLSSVGVFAAEGADTGAITDSLQKELGSSAQVLNTRGSLGVQMESYTRMIPLLSRTLMVFTGLVVVLVVCLMTASLVARSRRSSGLLKALGMTARQASARLRWSVLPPLLAGTALGCLAGPALVRPILGAMLSGVGIKQITTDIPAWPAYAAGAVILVTAMAAVRLATRPLGRLTAYCLLSE